MTTSFRRDLLVLSVLSALGTAGCFSPNISEGVTCGVDNSCPPSMKCDLSDNTCRTPGADNIDANTGEVDAGEIDAMGVCMPNVPMGCTGGKERRCNSTGTAIVESKCALGCNTDRCNDVDPSNELGDLLNTSFGAPALTLDTIHAIDSDKCTLDVDGGPILIRGTPVPAIPVNLCVFVVGSLTVSNASTLNLKGARAVAILSDGDVSVSGTIDLGGAGAVGTDCAGGPGLFDAAMSFSGGGGGGFGGAGGGGGRLFQTMNGSDVKLGGIGGNASGDADLQPLRGGCSGGGCKQGEDCVQPDSSGNENGGGAIQITSRTRILINAAGTINGGGGGGTRMLDVGGMRSGGTGGASGGAILLEAPIVEINGGLFANGGGGGSCHATQNGEPGQLGTAPASGAPLCPLPSGAGGAGAALSVVAGSGTESTGSNGGGGGGGGVGRIRLNSLDSELPTGDVSPAPSLGLIETR